MGSDSDPCIMGQCKCGCEGVIYANACDPLTARDQSDIGRMVIEGYTISRMTVAEGRALMVAKGWRCVAKRKAAA